MKLHEEFKEYENLWEADMNPYLKTFGRKTYDLTNKDELKAWIETNAEFQMKRYPGRYTMEPGAEPAVGDGGERALQLRSTIIRNLCDKLEAEGVDRDLLLSARDELYTSLGASIDRHTSIIRAKEQKQIAAAVEAGLTAFETEMKNNLSYFGVERILPKAREELKNELITKVNNIFSAYNKDYEKYFGPRQETSY